MKEFIFGIDCDEVFRDNLGNMLKVYNQDYNDNKKIEDIFDFQVDKVFPRIFQESGETASSYFFNKYSKEVFYDAKVIPGALDAINTLRKYGKVIIVTYQKNLENKELTLNWLDKNNIPYDGICFLRDKTLIHADYLIDDNDWNFIGCNCNHGILIDRPYNHNKSLDDIKKASNCKTMDRFTSLNSFATWFENNIDIFKKYEDNK